MRTGEPMRYRTVLFDLDGTLIDSIGLIVASYRHTVRSFGLEPPDDAVWLRGIGTPLAAQLAPFAKDDAMLEAMITTYRAYNLSHHDASVRAYDGVVDAVRALRREGVRLAVVTSKSRSGALRGLGLVGLDDEFDALVALEDVDRPKPHREPVDRALERLSAERATALFVGDSVHDMQSGGAAEVATAAAMWGPFSRADLAPGRPTHWLDAPGDVLTLLR